MNEECWAKQSLDCLAARRPERLMKRCFIDKTGRPDPGKMPEAVVVHGIYSGYKAQGERDLRAAIKSVPGLCYHAKEYSAGYRHFTFTIGWGQAAVEAGVQRQARAKVDAKKVAEDKVRKIQAALVGDSLVGEYRVECREIEKEFLDGESGDMTMDVKELREDGIYVAAIDLDVLEGVMLLSTDVAKLDAYAEAHEDDEDDYDYDDYDDDDETQSGDGSSNREASEEDKPYHSDYDSRHISGICNSTGQAVQGPATHVRAGCGEASSSQPQQRNSTFEAPREGPLTGSMPIFHTFLRGRETGEGEMDWAISKGSLQADGRRFINLTGKTHVPFIGQVTFKALKISDTCRNFGDC